MLAKLCLLIVIAFGATKGVALHPTNFGGTVEGDPAPGRSPGPPPVSESVADFFKVRAKPCALDGDVVDEDVEDGPLNLTIDHQLFETDLIVSGITYQVTVGQYQGNEDIEFTLSSAIGSEPRGRFDPKFQQPCPSHFFRSLLRAEEEESTLTLNWTVGGREFEMPEVQFHLHYKYLGEGSKLHRKIIRKKLTRECRLSLKPNTAAIVSWRDFPHGGECQMHFPILDVTRGLLVELLKLNVPCARGYLHFTDTNGSAHALNHHAHRQFHVCGKLEELTEQERHVYLPAGRTNPTLHFKGSPTFTLTYRMVDFCYNLTFTTRNGSFEVTPRESLDCTLQIALPYGNRVSLTLQIGTPSVTTIPADVSTDSNDHSRPTEECEGLLLQVLDGNATWRHCAHLNEPGRRIDLVSRDNRMVVKMRTRTGLELRLRMSYRNEAIEEIVGKCAFGWVALRQFCIAALEGARLPWAQAEIECGRKGGHLISIQNQQGQELVDQLLFNSPGYKDHNAYWIGASDKANEGDFRWTDGLPFTYTNWFPGWIEHSYYNRQPNDDGLSEQDCVEVRRVYSLPASPPRYTHAFMWNDRDCSTPNYFVCERLQSDEPLEEVGSQECNRTINLSRQQIKTALSSPGFPRPYPDNTYCETDVIAPLGYRLVLDFEELVLENEPSCSYDYLEIVEMPHGNVSNGTITKKRLCGDWSEKLKLLRYVSNGSQLKLRFNSDYSHHFGGFKARISMENALQCSDDRLLMFNTSCYLFVNYPEVTWSTAQQICMGISAHLTTVISPEEQQFISSNIRKSPEYRTSALYWLGGKTDAQGHLRWTNGDPMTYPGRLPWPARKEGKISCLSLQWMSAPTPLLPSGLYWHPTYCDAVGGYVCRRPVQTLAANVNFNRTVNGTSGTLQSPNYPENYYDNLDFAVRIVAPERTRIVVHFDHIDLESQTDCLYDYVALSSADRSDEIKWCGNHEHTENRFDFVSQSSEATLTFHSDYSVHRKGFALRWYAVDVSGCPAQTMTASEGTLTSPNYPDFLLPGINCTVTILAPAGKRIWFEFADYDIEDNDEADTTIQLGDDSVPLKSYTVKNIVTDGAYVSNADRLSISLFTSKHPRGKGFKAFYRTANVIREQRIINLTQITSGSLLYLNYPNAPPGNVQIAQHLVAPMGRVIALELYDVRLTETKCDGNESVIEVYDNYANENGTSWQLCPYKNMLQPPVTILSYLNTLHIRQKSYEHGVYLNGSVRVQSDTDYKSKLIKHHDSAVEFCLPNPCLNGGKCVSNSKRQLCECSGYFTGIFCSLTECDLEPCLFGKCELTINGYKCHCKVGYVGPNCDQKQRPCEGNPCESRGVCVEKGNGFTCKCHAWWEGTRCEKRMLHIPYKPLSKRMLEEPFWLGLIAVAVVMGILGLIWCARRHFPEKIEKLLAEDPDHRGTNLPASLRTSLREQLAASGAAAAVQVTPSPGPGVPRTLFGRLGIRKPSILSLTSPRSSGYSPATARTFSLDDLLKPPRRTPSPRKKRNNSTPTKKNVAEKKQILQQLVAPGNKQMSRKVSLGELIQLSERKTKRNTESRSSIESQCQSVKETNLSVNATQIALTDPKLEKKVTFARLLNKVSAEMSSGSEMELGLLGTSRLGFTRPSSTPPSPAADFRSPNSTCSNQGSGTFSESDLAIPSALSCSISDLISTRKHARLPNGKQKPASADSILAMFRNFSSSSVGINRSSSLKVSPSTTPTASSPQDDVAGDDDSSSSSAHTPISFSSGLSESPIMHRQSPGTIEVPVLDALSAHRSSGGSGNLLHPPTILLEIPSTINKCLSPIREMPTPLPSPMPTPAMTPIMPRSTASSSINDISIDSSDDHISIEIPNFSISDDDDFHCSQDVAIDPLAEDGLIREEAAVMQGGKFKNKKRPPPLGSAEALSLTIPKITMTSESPPPPPIVIPTLIIQTPSPTHKPSSPSLQLPGSPPPHRANQCENFFFSSAKTARKMLKDHEKPSSLDLPSGPPMITITCNMSDVESDIDTLSPAIKCPDRGASTSAGMCYLSPFPMGSRHDRGASESNLSSSGYSSMASPGPSRCGSSNPLCPSEMEDPPGPGSNPHPPLTRRPSPLLQSSSGSAQEPKDNSSNHERVRSDSETMSDDPLIESNDEGIGTDHLEEKIDEGEVKSAKELEVFITTECVDGGESSSVLDGTVAVGLRATKCVSLDANMDRCKSTTLQLPSIVVQSDATEKLLSPMSSRSESPLSDRTIGLDRFSPQFYGRNKDSLPFTDSDGLYDFPSSDKVNITSSIQHHRKSTGRRRGEKRAAARSPSHAQSQQHLHLDVPIVAPKLFPTSTRKPSPKRRTRTHQLISSSSSSDSLTLPHDGKLSSASPSPETTRWPSPKRRPRDPGPHTEYDVAITVHPKSLEELPRATKRMSRLRAISNQLRRLELNLKRRERVVTPTDSLDSGEESPRVTSPLLPEKEPRPTTNVSKLASTTKNRRCRRGGSLLIPDEEKQLKRVTITESVFSD